MHCGPIRGKQFCHSLPLSFSLIKYQSKAEIHHVELRENHAEMHLEQHYQESFLKILISRATPDDFEAVLSGVQESISLRNNLDDSYAPSLRTSF